MSFLDDFGPALMNLDSVGLDAPAEGDGYVITRAGLDALETALIVPDAAEAELSEDTEEGPAGAQGAAEAPAEVFTPDTREKADWVRFTIDSEDKANWLLRKLANLDAERRRVTAQTEDILAGVAREEAALQARFGSDLAHFAAGELARRGGHGKTLKLAQGSVAFRTVPASLKVVDTGAALAYCARHGLPMVRTVETLDAALYRELAADTLRETGDTLPGVETLPARESVGVKFRPGQ